MKNNKNKVVYAVFILLYIIVITALYLAPVDVVPKIKIPRIDKIFHVFSYAAFGWLSISIMEAFNVYWRRMYLWVFLIIFGHACVVEFLQGYLTVLNRNSTYFDLFLNTLGIALGISLRLLYVHVRTRNDSKN